ncbi:MAG: DUF6602 domain-containing protein [Hyphomicrobiaceae bacterium]
MNIASGQIIECASGRLSRQHDIILFDGSILPPITFDDSTSILPIESVLYTIEIKSKLTRTELVDAHKSAQELAEFKYLSGASHQNLVEQQIGKLVSVIFALESDLKPSEHGEVARYKGVYGDGEPHLKALCIVGRGYWFESDGSWVKAGSNGLDEVIAFIGGVMNTYKQISATRGLQSLGHYIISSPPSFQTFPSGTKPTINVVCENCCNKGVVFFNSETTERKEWPD